MGKVKDLEYGNKSELINVSRKIRNRRFQGTKSCFSPVLTFKDRDEEQCKRKKNNKKTNVNALM